MEVVPIRPHTPRRLSPLRVVPFLAILLAVLSMQVLLSQHQQTFPGLTPVDGVLDLTDVDVSDTVFQVSNNWDFYPNRLYDAQDFAQGTPEEKAAPEVSAAQVPYGTYRLVIQAQPNRYYEICGFSIDYATRVLVNGEEVFSCGVVSDRAQTSVPQVDYMTIPLFSGEDGTIELIYQYCNFVHRDGGFIQSTYLSTPDNIEGLKRSNDLASLSLSGGLILLALYFLLCAGVEQRWDFLSLALCCLLMALRDQNFYNIHLLPSYVPWPIMYRVFILIVMLLPVSVLLLLKSLYPKATRHWPLGVYLSLAVVASALLFLLPTQDLVQVSTTVYYLSIPYLLYLLAGVALHYGKLRRFQLADGLTLVGYVLMLWALVYEALFTSQNSAIAHYGFAPLGTLAAVFCTAIAISLRAQARERAWVESRSRSRMLEQMNQLNMDFLRKVAHELKTPLTVISGYAQLTGMQLSTNHLSQETPENLRTIQQEAQRLAEMVTRLMEYSYGRTQEATLGPVSVEELLSKVQAIAAPMCLKNNNVVACSPCQCPRIHGNFEMLLQIFINLVFNANKHTQGGTITLSAAPAQGDMVRFQVTDTGSGIDPQDLPHIFQQGYSTTGSSGLGLVICREAVEAHGGKIWVEQSTPAGTTFCFTIPREEAIP